MPYYVTNNFEAALRIVETTCYSEVAKAGDDLIERYHEALGSGDAGIVEDTGALANSFYMVMTGYRGRKTYEEQMKTSRELYLEGTKTHQDILNLLPNYAYTEEGFKKLLLPKAGREIDAPGTFSAVISSGLATSVYWELGHNSILDNGRNLRSPFMRRIARAALDDFEMSLGESLRENLSRLPRGRL